MKPTSQTLDDELTGQEPAYQSSAHAEIGRMLDRYGIPFVYRQPTPVLDGAGHRIAQPDFTLPDYGGVVIVYAGPSVQARDAFEPKHAQDTYHRNGIPAIRMYPGDLDSPTWDRQLHRRILEAYEQSLRQPDAVTAYK